MHRPLFDRSILQAFPSTYAIAEAAFLAEVQRTKLPHRLTRLPYEGSTPTGGGLMTPLLWLGNPDASKLLVLLSAVHGVEGFAGSAIQLDLLRRLNDQQVMLADDLAVVMVHGVNPWGFAWCRRVDETGVDVNRNFVDFNQPLPVNPGYRALASALLPRDKSWQQADAELAQYRQAHGQYEYELAVSGGQYEFPEGLFYGGRQPTQARQNMERVIAEVGTGRSVAVVDLHTGLGPYGYGELICDHPLESSATATAKRWYGAGVTLPATGDSCSVPKLGLVDYAWHQIMAEGSCYVTLEFGTFSLTELLACLRLDHCRRQPGRLDWDDPAQQQARDRLKHQFYPAESQWQTMVLFRARQVIQMACSGLFDEAC